MEKKAKLFSYVELVSFQNLSLIFLFFSLNAGTNHAKLLFHSAQLKVAFFKIIEGYPWISAAISQDDNISTFAIYRLQKKVFR